MPVKQQQSEEEKIYIAINPEEGEVIAQGSLEEIEDELSEYINSCGIDMEDIRYSIVVYKLGDEVPITTRIKLG